jgi:hypothetical protein
MLQIIFYKLLLLFTLLDTDLLGGAWLSNSSGVTTVTCSAGLLGSISGYGGGGCVGTAEYCCAHKVQNIMNS